jgi:hypothetical protein
MYLCFTQPIQPTPSTHPTQPIPIHFAQGIAPDIEAVIPSTILGDQDVSVVRPEDFVLKDDMCLAAAAGK